MIWWIIILANYTLFVPFTVSVDPYTDSVIIKIWLTDCHFELKLPNAFSAFHPAANTSQLKCLYCLLVPWQYGTLELVFGMIITDPEHWRLRLKWQDDHGIIAQRTPYKSHNAKRTWFVLVFDIFMQWVYFHKNFLVYFHKNFLTNMLVSKNRNLKIFLLKIYSFP